MIIQSKAPFRIGLAGGGTDVPPYSTLFGGAVLNATINLYAYVTIEPRNDRKIAFKMQREAVFDSALSLSIKEDQTALLKGVYNRIVKDYTKQPLSFTLTCNSDTAYGSGLGTSSALTVALIGAFSKWLSLDLDNDTIASLAYEIERVDLKQAGGKQDQYAAAFGGCNFLEFNSNNVIVNKLLVNEDIIEELSSNLLLYNTNTLRKSGEIIKQQQFNIENKVFQSIEAMHFIKQQAYDIKDAILGNKLNDLGEILHEGWVNKKKTADNISNPTLDKIYNLALEHGASGGKVSGAGGGGYMLFYCPNNTRHDVSEALSKQGGEIQPYLFTNKGLESWYSK